MNDFPEPKTVIEFVGVALMGVLSWIGRGLHRDVRELQDNSVTREELRDITTQMREDRVKMHEQDREDLQYIRERVDAIADRQ